MIFYIPRHDKYFSSWIGVMEFIIEVGGLVYVEVQDSEGQVIKSFEILAREG